MNSSVVQYQHTMNSTEQRVASTILRVFQDEPEKFAPEMWAVSVSSGQQTRDFEAKVIYSEAVLRLNEFGVECHLVWQEGELTVSQAPIIDGVRVYQDEMQLADTDTKGALGKIVMHAHKATEDYVTDKNAELQEEHRALMADREAV